MATAARAFDVVVVGAGPAGGLVAQHVANAGLRVAIVEEHREASGAEAVGAGAKTFLGTQAQGAERVDGDIELVVDRDGDRMRLRTRLLIGCDGVRSDVAKWFGKIGRAHV